MKLQILRKLIPIACLLVSMNVLAYDFESGGIYYNITSTEAKTVEVTYKDRNYNSYTGEVTIPGSVTHAETTFKVTSIRSFAFYKCSGLTSIVVPNSVTSIGDQAFNDCDGLTSVTIPSSVTSIGLQAFFGCTGLTSVTFESTTPPYIGWDAFYGTSPTIKTPSFASILAYKAIEELKDKNFGHEIGGIYYQPTSDTEVEVTFKDKNYNSYTGEVVIPTEITVDDIKYNVTSIGSRAFSGCSGLTSVVIPNSVTSIGDWAFSSCNSLKSVTIPNFVTSIGGYAFAYCTGLTSVTIGNSVTSIGERAFVYCTGLTSVTFESTTPPSIEGYAFYKASPTIKTPFASILAYKAIEELKNKTFSNEIGGVYYLPTSDTEVEVTYKDKNYNSYTGKVVIPTEITVDDIKYKVISIGNDAFRNCDGLTSVVIPNSVTSIGYEAFYKCTGLTSVTFESTTPPSIGNEAFSRAYPTIKTPSLTSIFAYKAIEGLKNMTFASHEIGGIYYLPTSDTEVEVTYKDRNYNSYTGEVVIPTEITVDDIKYKVTSIGDHAFYNCNSLTSVVIPSSVTSIGGSAFSGCTGLTSVTIPSSVTSIGGWAFASCDGLRSVTFESTTPPSIGQYAFDGVLATIKTPFASVFAYKAIEGLKNRTFASHEIGGIYYLPTSDTEVEVTSNPSKYTGEVVIPAEITVDDIKYKVTSIGDHAFSSCSGLTSVTIGNSVTSIGVWAFSSCSGLTSVTIPSSVTSIGYYAFGGCTGLTSVTIPNSVTSISGSAFYGCTGLTSVTIPSSVTSIGDYAFSGCKGLTSVTFESTTPPSIGNSAFNYASATIKTPFASILAYKEIEELKNETFASPEIGGVYYLPTSDTEVEVTYKDKNYNSYTGEVVIPAEITVDDIKYNVTSISNYAFRDCDGLTSVVVPNSVTSIGDYAFISCTGLTSVTIGNSVTSIGSRAFYGCTGLPSVTIPNSVTSIGGSAFSGCNKLNGRLSLPSSITSIGEYAFSGTKYSICEIAATTPPTISSTSLSAETSLVLVPKGTPNTYKAADVWKNYTIIAEGSCDIVVTNKTGGELAKSIFNQTRKNLQNITGLKVQGTLNSIDLELINTNMSSLLYLDITETDVTEIPAEAFKDVATLVSVKLPSTLQTIGDYAFSGCKVLSGELILPEKLTKIGNYAFQNCSGLSGTLKIPANVTYINSYAFSGCYNIKNLDMTEATKLYEIGTNAFRGCTTIESVDMAGASRLINLGTYMFSGCTGLKNVDMTGAKSLTSLSSYIFNGCNSLETVLFPETLETIGNYAFYNCVKLDNLKLPAALKSINSSAFYGCTGMTSIDFSACTSLSTIYGNAFYGCVGLTMLDLSTCNSLITIKDSAFSGCSALATINFPTSLVSIGSKAFANCTNLLQLSVPCTIPPVIENHAEPFAGVDNIACILSIPSDNLFDYYSANYWGGFVDAEKSEVQNDVNDTTDEEGEGDETGKHKKHKGCKIRFKKHHKNGHSPRLKALNGVNTLAETEDAFTASDLGITGDGQSLFVGFGESVTYYLIPDEGKEIESVYFNDEDVTSQLVNNTLTVTVTSDMTMTSFVVNMKNASPKLAGDINGDGEVNVTDVVKLYSYILGNATDVEDSVADLNGDGEVNVSDIVKLYSIILSSN